MNDQTEPLFDSGGYIPEGNAFEISKQMSKAYKTMSPAVSDFENATDHLSYCLADCHILVDSISSDAGNVQNLLPQVRDNFAKMEAIFASVDRLEEMVATATTNVDMLEHEMNLAERDLLGQSNSAVGMGRSVFSQPSTSSPSQRPRPSLNSAGIAIKRLFKKQPRSSSSSSNSPSSPSTSSAGDGLYLAPPQVFYASDYFPNSTSSSSQQTGSEAT